MPIKTNDFSVSTPLCCAQPSTALLGPEVGGLRRLGKGRELIIGSH